MRVFPAVVAALLLPACAGPPAEVRDALATQAKYTKLYVEYANALIEKSGRVRTLSDGREHTPDEMLGIGDKLVQNARELAAWGRGEPVK